MLEDSETIVQLTGKAATAGVQQAATAVITFSPSFSRLFSWLTAGEISLTNPKEIAVFKTLSGELASFCAPSKEAQTRPSAITSCWKYLLYEVDGAVLKFYEFTKLKELYECICGHSRSSRRSTASIFWSSCECCA